jgi:cell division protein FtsQ
MARNERFSPDSPTRAPYEREEFAASIADSEFHPTVAGVVDDLDELEPIEEPLNDPQFLRAQRRVPVRKGPVTKKTAQRLRWFLGVGAIVAAGAVVIVSVTYYGTHSWRFRVDGGDNIETAGLTKITRAQIMRVMGEDIGRNVFKVPLDDRKRQLEEIPWVQTASVMRLLPDRLRIQIVERTPVAYVRIGSRVSLIDGTGVVMEIPARTKLSYSFPVITGMLASEPLSTRAARMRIYARLIDELDSGGMNYSRDVSEVDLADPEDVKITVEDAGGALVVHLGSSDFLERYRVYISHIQEWRQQFKRLDSVDLRFHGQIIVNPDTRDQQVASQP